MNNATTVSTSSTRPPLPPDTYKNNLIKAKTDEIDSYMKYAGRFVNDAFLCFFVVRSI